MFVVGMIFDNAQMVKRDDVELIVSASCDGKCLLALPKSPNVPTMGAASAWGTLEMSLEGFSLSTAPRARSGDGLEHTMVDFFYCWALACITITLPGEARRSGGTAITGGAIVAQALDLDNADRQDAEARQALFEVMAEVRNNIQAQKVRVVLRVRPTKKNEIGRPGCCGCV